MRRLNRPVPARVSEQSSREPVRESKALRPCRERRHKDRGRPFTVTPSFRHRKAECLHDVVQFVGREAADDDDGRWIHEAPERNGMSLENGPRQIGHDHVAAICGQARELRLEDLDVARRNGSISTERVAVASEVPGDVISRIFQCVWIVVDREYLRRSELDRRNGEHPGAGTTSMTRFPATPTSCSNSRHSRVVA